MLSSLHFYWSFALLFISLISNHYEIVEVKKTQKQKYKLYKHKKKNEKRKKKQRNIPTNSIIIIAYLTEVRYQIYHIFIKKENWAMAISVAQ